MRVTTTTLENGNVQARSATRKRTVKADVETDLNRRHAEAAAQVRRVSDDPVNLSPTAEVVSDTRIVWDI